MQNTNRQTQHIISMDNLVNACLRQIHRQFVPDDKLQQQQKPLSAQELTGAKLTLTLETALSIRKSVVAGLDYGKDLSHFIVLGKLSDASQDLSVVIYSEEILANEPNGYRDIDRAAELVHKFGIETIVDDANGIGADRHRILKGMCPEIPVIGGFFDTAAYDRKENDLTTPHLHGASITVSKVAAVSSLLKALRNGRLLLRDDLENLQTVEDHLQSMYVCDLPRGRHDVIQPCIKYVHYEDHFFSALMYARLAQWSLSNET
ncbi:MAG: hypothetical protein JNM27_18590 [Leptospirales bacterium]|nr:hypothetical protein [Leptospirales bacterium]